MRATPYNAKLDFQVAEVLADAPNPDLEPGAYISGGITYVNPRSRRGIGARPAGAFGAPGDDPVVDCPPENDTRAREGSDPAGVGV